MLPAPPAHTPATIRLCHHRATRAGSNALPRWQDWLQVGARAVLTHLADARRRCVDASRRPPATAARSAIARGSVQSAITPSFGARGGGLTWTYRYQILSGRNGLCPPMLSPIQNLLFFSKKMTPGSGVDPLIGGWPDIGYARYEAVTRRFQISRSGPLCRVQSKTSCFSLRKRHPGSGLEPT